MVKWLIFCLVFFIVNVNAVKFDELFKKALLHLITIYEQEKSAVEISFWTKKRNDIDYRESFKCTLSESFILMLEDVSDLTKLTEFTDSKKTNDSKDLIDFRELNDSQEPIDLKETVDPKKLKGLIKSTELNGVMPLAKLLLIHENKQSEVLRLFPRKVQS